MPSRSSLGFSGDHVRSSIDVQFRSKLRSYGATPHELGIGPLPSPGTGPLMRYLKLSREFHEGQSLVIHGGGQCHDTGTLCLVPSPVTLCWCLVCVGGSHLSN